MHFARIAFVCACLAMPISADAFFGFGAVPAGPKGVHIHSDAPIFDPSKGLRIKRDVEVIAVGKSPGDDLMIIGEKVAALRKPDRTPYVLIHALRWDNGTYRMQPLPGAGDVEDLSGFFGRPSSNLFWGKPFSIHSTPDDKIYVAQVHRTSNDGDEFYQYFYLRFYDSRLYYDESAYDFKPDEETFSIPGAELRKKQVYVRSKTALFAALDAQAESEKYLNIKTASLRHGSNFGAFLVESDLNAMRREVFSALCLHLAESPGDPGRERGRKDSSVPFAFLNPDHAVPVCEAALAAGTPTPSVRFSATRALTAKARRDNDVALNKRVKSMLDELASEGFAPAMLNLAMYNFGGPGVDPDPSAVKSGLERLAQAGNPQAAYWLGRAIRLRWVEGTSEETRRYLQQAIDAKIIEGYGEMGQLLKNIDSTNAQEDADTYFIKGAELEDPESIFQLGLTLYKGKHYYAAYKRFASAAKLGHLEALYYEGFMKMAGQGVKANEVSAKSSFEHAARHQHLGAKLYLGHLLCRNQTAKKREERHKRGKALLEEAQAAGYARAETYLQDCKI